MLQKAKQSTSTSYRPKLTPLPFLVQTQILIGFICLNRWGVDGPMLTVVPLFWWLMIPWTTHPQRRGLFDREDVTVSSVSQPHTSASPGRFVRTAIRNLENTCFFWGAPRKYRGCRVVYYRIFKLSFRKRFCWRGPASNHNIYNPWRRGRIDGIQLHVSAVCSCGRKAPINTSSSRSSPSWLTWPFLSAPVRAFNLSSTLAEELLCAAGLECAGCHDPLLRSWADVLSAFPPHPAYL